MDTPTLKMERGTDGAWTLKIPPELLAAKEPTAEAEQPAAIQGIADFEINGIPVGAAALGGAAAVFVTELISGFTPKVDLPAGVNPELLTQALGAWALIQWGPNLIGKEAATIGASFVAFQAVRAFIPLDEQIRKIVRGVTNGNGGRGADAGTVDAAQSRIETAPADQGAGLPALAAGRLALAGL